MGDILFGVFLALQFADLSAVLRDFLWSRPLSVRGWVFPSLFRWTTQRIQRATRSPHRPIDVMLDPEGSLVYFILFFGLSSVVLSLFPVSPKLKVAEVVILQCAVGILLVDSLLWVQRMPRLLFTRYRGKLIGIEVKSGDDEKKNARVRDEATALAEGLDSISTMTAIPKLMVRISVFLAILILVYAVIYHELAQIAPESFVDVITGTSVNSFDTLFAYSISTVANMDSGICPGTSLSKISSALQGLSVLYTVALFVSFFTSLSAEDIFREKSDLRKRLDGLLRDD